MLFKNIKMLDENFELKENMYLGTEGDKITFISDKAPEYPERFGEVYARSNGKLFIPGFYNAHSHAAMILLRGYGENLSLMDWLFNRIFPFEGKLNQDDVYNATIFSVAEMLRFGIVGTTDMYMFADTLGRAFADSGAKANFSVGCTCSDDVDFKDIRDYKNTLDMIKKYSGYDNGRLIPEFSLHAEYTNSERVTRGLAEAAKEAGSSIHIHLSETEGEVAECRERHGGRSPVKYLCDCGIFDVHTTAAHCVAIDDDDIAILKEKNVSVATNPKSNLKLASGVMPAAKLIAAGVNVALGTDSVASNNNLNMLEEMKFFALIHKGISGDPIVITPKEVLYAATRAGAISQQRYDCGLLKEGFKADIVAVDTDNVYMHPAHNILNNLIYSACGTDVSMTMVDGKVLYDNGKYTLLDIEKLRSTAESSRLRILSELS